MSKKDENGGKVLISPGAADELKLGIEALDRANAAQFYYCIRRRRPGDTMIPIWKRHIPIADIDDIERFCYDSVDGGPEYEYRINITDDRGRNARTTDGKEIPARDLPARSSSTIPTQKPPLPGQDPLLAEREQQLHRCRRELELKRQEAALEKERRRFEKKLEDVDGDEDEEEHEYRRPPPYYPGYRFAPYGYGQSSPWMAGQVPPWMRQPAKDEDRTFQLLLAMIQSQNQRPQFDPVQFFQMMMPFLASGKFEPADMMKVMGPMMTSISEVSAESQKIAMQSMADNDRMLKEKMLDLLEVSGASGDDLDRWKKILNMATDTVGGIAKAIFRRNAEPGAKVEIPRLAGAQPPRIAGPSSNPPRPPQPAPQQRPQAAPPQPKRSPEEEAQEVVRQRVSIFLQAHEQEMHIGADPVLIAEKFDDIYLALPEDLRVGLEKGEVADIYDTLRRFDAETVDRILGAVAKDGSGKKKEWCTSFWYSIFHPDEGDGDEEGEGDEGDDEVGEEEDEGEEPGSGKEGERESGPEGESEVDDA